MSGKRPILAKISEPVLSALATITEDGKPWVRYVTPWADENLILWVATFVNSRKVSQIRKNPDVHLTTGVTNPESAESYLQIEGRAEILNDAEIKKTVWTDHLQGIFEDPGDPNYCVCKITPYWIEFTGMGLTPPEVWEP